MEEETVVDKDKALDRVIDKVTKERDLLKGMGDSESACIRGALAGAERHLAELRAQRTAMLSPVRLAHKVGNELERCARKEKAAAAALQRCLEGLVVLKAQPGAIAKDADERACRRNPPG